MDKILIEVNDPGKRQILLEFLKQLNFLTISEPKIKTGRKKNVLRDLYGIWEGRDINLSEIRKSAWKRR
ncbi:MAG: hypothetical protein HYV28_01055 [Ignavibacteriales bacterium]|nr:hypothetical protein [Ignavibacteriales bacterium]